MKICFISMDLFSYGGVQRVLSRLLSELNEKSQFEINIIMPRLPDSKNIFGLDESIKIINYYNFRSKDKGIKSFLYRAIRRVNKYTKILDNAVCQSICNVVYFPRNEREKITEFIRREKYDLVVGVGDRFTLLLGTIRQDLDCKCIGWMHSTFASYFQYRGEECYGLLKYARTQYQKLDYIMVLTDRDIANFKNEFKVKTIKLQNPVNYFCETPKCDPFGPIIFIGRMVKRHKGLDYLAEIIDKYHQSDPERKFIVLGNGPDKQWFDKQIRTRRLDKVVCAPGFVSNIDEYLRKSSLFIHTSRWEGFGVVIVEAMMYGLPVVAFHNDGPDEIISDGQDGYLVKCFDCEVFANKMAYALKDKYNYNRLSSNANQKAKQFMPEKITDRFINIIENN